MATVLNDPWETLEPPSAVSAVNARRVDEKNPWEFFWARALDGKCLLVLRHRTESSPTRKLPTLKGINVAVSAADKPDIRMLVFCLLDSRQRDIFHQLCLDVVGATTSATKESDAIDLALARTWRWHHLLRGGAVGRLSEEEQKGLIGEMLVLERYILPRHSPLDSLIAWRGPLGSPKDFEIGSVCIEAKARRGAAMPFVVITSEFQLDGFGCSRLFLCVADLSRSPEDANFAFSVSDIARRLLVHFESNSSAIDKYESLLTAAGFRWEDDYSDYKWIQGSSRIYEVTAGFPRVTATEIATGLSNVRYSLSLIECERFAVDENVLVEALSGADHGG